MSKKPPRKSTPGLEGHFPRTHRRTWGYEAPGPSLQGLAAAAEARERDGTTWAWSGPMVHVVSRELNRVIAVVSALCAVQWHLVDWSIRSDERGKRCGRQVRAKMCARAHRHQPEWYLRYSRAL